ncbi:uncharacterized protein ACN2A1_002160 isoform 1-T1 [Glossina fuscipes fuscipes]
MKSKDPAIISNVPLVADVYNLISGPIFIIWHLNIIITTIQQRRNSDLVSTDGNENEEKSSFKDRHDIVTKNYVKPVMFGFLVVSSLIYREAEQKQHLSLIYSLPQVV